jgi:hypothetical protein
MFAVTLRLANRVRTYSVSAMGVSGWEIRLEEDAQVRRLDHYHDWHRVERALDLFAREASALQASGWQVVSGQSMNR